MSKYLDPDELIAINASNRTIKAGEPVYFVGTFTHPDDGTKTPCVAAAGELTAGKREVRELPDGTFEVSYPFDWKAGQ